jgi:hypothetical protein
LPDAEVGWNANLGGAATVMVLPPTFAVAVTFTYSVLVAAISTVRSPPSP